MILSSPRAPSYLNSGLLGYVTIGYLGPRTHYLGNWSPKDLQRHTIANPESFTASASDPLGTLNPKPFGIWEPSQVARRR